MLINDLKVVLNVSEFRSITKAAANLDMQIATASAALKRVEKSLGADLFIRSTRKLRLSSAGERYIPECKKALLMLEQAKQNMKNERDVVDGELRIAVSSDLGRNLVNSWLDEFMQTYANLKLKINISDSNVDFYRDKVDVALRYGSPNDSNLFGFKICNVPGVLCANKKYLNKYGTPENLNDLAQHNGLFYQLYEVVHDVWKFTNNSKVVKVKMSGNRASNDGDLVRRWCVAGHGLAVKSCLDMSRDLLSGKVQSLMSEYRPRSTELWLICPSRQLISPAVRLLRDTLKQKCSEILISLVRKGILRKEDI
jgi:DNA-binding transcriptional LysR family regulator